MTVADYTVTSPDGVEIGCMVEGSGPPLVMVHGAAIDHHCFDPITERLAEHFTLYRMDRRGRGVSGDREEWSPALEFADVAAVVDSFDAPIRLFGHSFGGLCSLEATALSKNLTRTLLYDPIIPGLTPLRNPDTQNKIIAAKTPEEVITIHLTEWMGLNEERLARQQANKDVWARRLGWAHTMQREYAMEDHYVIDADALRSISIPLRVLIGENSQRALQASADWIEREVSTADKRVLHGQSHYAFASAPDMLLAEMLDFLQA